jgi:hypothetical protein
MYKGHMSSIGFTKSSVLHEEQLFEMDVIVATIQEEQINQCDMGTDLIVGQTYFNNSPSNREVAFQPKAYVNQYVLGDMFASTTINLVVKLLNINKFVDEYF